MSYQDLNNQIARLLAEMKESIERDRRQAEKVMSQDRILLMHKAGK
jgi:hypothetical protein